MHEDDFSSEKVCGANTSSRRVKHECEMTIFLENVLACLFICMKF